MTISDILKEKGKLNYKVKSQQPKREKLTEDQFLHTLFRLVGNRMKYGVSGYDLDDNNRHVIEQLFYYYNKDDKFNGNLEKGILLAGAIGCGKTILMGSFFEMLCANEQSNKWMNSTDIADYLSGVKEDTRFGKRLLYVDDIGKEQSDVKHYGNLIHPFEELVRKKYNTGLPMFGTTNLKYEDMSYVGHTVDRMKEMFNFIVLPGKSRRK